MINETDTKKPIYNEIPKQVSRKDFNKYINPHLRKPMNKNQRFHSTKYSTIFCMSYTLVYNGINSKQDVMNYIGPMSINVIIYGPNLFFRYTAEREMVRIRNYYLLLSLT